MTTFTPLNSAVTNRIQLAYAKESSEGNIPAVAFQAMRVKSQTLNAAQTYTASQELRSDRQIPDQVLTDRNISGDMGFELSYGAGMDLMAGVVQDITDWNTPAHAVYTNVAATVTTNTYTVASGGASAVAGHLIYASGFTNAGNNGVHPVTSSTSTTIVTSDSLTTETAGASKTVKIIGFVGAAGDITATLTGLGSTSLDFTTLGLIVGQWVKIGGAAAGTQYGTAANNGFARITAIGAHALTLDNLPASWAADAGTGKTIRVIVLDYIRNGTTVSTFTVERGHLDVSEFFQFVGCHPEKMTLQFQTGQILDGTFTFRGLSHPTPTAATASTGAVLTAPTGTVMNAVNNVVQVYEGGSAAGRMKTATLTAMNALRDQKAIGVLGDAGVGDGQFSATMQFTAYFTSGYGATAYGKFQNATQTSLSMVIQDASGNAYIPELPACKFTAATVEAGQINQDCMVNITASALLDSTVTNAMFQLSRLPAYGA